MTIQQTHRYLEYIDIENAHSMSLASGKASVISDFPGTGKTTVLIEFAIRNKHQGVLIVVEKVSTANELKAKLIRAGVSEKEVGVYHHKSKESVEDVYKASYSKPISIVTHKRLVIDPVNTWLFQANVPDGMEVSKLSRVEKRKLKLKSVNAEHKKEIILVDEQPDLIESVKLDRKSFSRLFNEGLVKDAIEKAFNGQPLSIIDAKSLISSNVDPWFIRIRERLNQYKKDKTLTVNDILKVLGIFKYQNSHLIASNLLSSRLSMRLACLVRKIVIAILTGTIYPVTPDNTLVYKALITPLSDFEGGIVILDGSAIYGEEPILSLYGKSYFNVLPPSTRPSEATVTVKIVKAPASKVSLMKMDDQDELQDLNRKSIETLISLTKTDGKKQFVSYMDKDKPGSRNSEDVLTEDSNEEIITLETEETIEVKVKFKSQVEDILKDLEFNYLRLEANNLDSAFEANDEDSTNSPDWYLAHYGLMKGSNALDMVDTVILQGGYYYPKNVYQQQQVFSESKESFKHEQASNTALQEILRSRIRVGGHIHLILGNDSEKDELALWIDKLLFTLRKYYVVQIDKTETDMEKELKKQIIQNKLKLFMNGLRKEPKILLEKILKKHPELASNSDDPDEYITTVNLTELGNEENSTGSKLKAKLEAISTRSDEYLVMKEISTSISKSGTTTVQLWFKR